MDSTEQIIVKPVQATESGKLLERFINEVKLDSYNTRLYDDWINAHASNDVGSKALSIGSEEGKFLIFFENLTVTKPQYTHDGKTFTMLPQYCRDKGITYASDWRVDLVLKERDEHGVYHRKDTKSNVAFCSIPIMTKSSTCELRGKTDIELRTMGEDPDDSAGQFIIDGTERCVLYHEQLCYNRIFLTTIAKKKTPVCRMVVTLPNTTALVELGLSDGKAPGIIDIFFSSLKGTEESTKSTINALRMFRIYGYDNVEDIKNIILMFIKPEHHSKCMYKLLNNIIDFIAVTDDYSVIYNYMDQLPGKKKDKMTQQEAVDRLLATEFFPHVDNLLGPDGETEEERASRIINAKLFLLAIMIAQMLEHMAGFREVEDKDIWSNKRIQGAGRTMRQLFRLTWAKLINTIQRDINSGNLKLLTDVASSMGKNVRSNIITTSFISSFKTGGWGIKGGKLKKDVTQIINRDNIISAKVHPDTIDVNLSRTDQQTKLRQVQRDQYGFICPVSTSEGKNAGLVKDRSVVCQVSIDRTDNEIIRYIVGDSALGVEAKATFDTDEAYDKGYNYKLMVNGKFLGWADGITLEKELIDGRRENKFFNDMSVIREQDYPNPEDGGWLHVDISPNRPLNPLLIVTADQEIVMNKLGLEDATIKELFARGAMEYLSPWEQTKRRVALEAKDITKRLDAIKLLEETVKASKGLERELAEQTLATYIKEHEPFTHCSIDGKSFLSLQASLVPYPGNNQAPRNSYAATMGKQAVGNPHINYLNRMSDTKLKLLLNPKRSICETEAYHWTGLDVRGSGEMIKVMFMPYSANQEDSFIVKRQFLQAGGFRMKKYSTFKTTINSNSEVSEKLARPTLRTGESQDKYKHIRMGADNDPGNGLPEIGAYLQQGDCIIGKIQTNSVDQVVKNASVFLKVGDQGIVDKVMVSNNGQTMNVTVRLRIMHIPEAGDKFATRNAQKGTIGLVLDDVDMPAGHDGVVPDFIVNVHSIPSRMTISYLLEIMASKYGAFVGEFINSSPFEDNNLDLYRKVLSERYTGDLGTEAFDTLDRNTETEYQFSYESCFSGTNGLPFDRMICTGPVFFQALKHISIDKIQVRGKGQIRAQTHQPQKGRKDKGAIKYGEMERDAAISHGASSLLLERLKKVSDGYDIALCHVCGTIAENNKNSTGGVNEFMKCILCGNTDFGHANIPYCYKLLMHYAGAFGIRMTNVYMDTDEYTECISRGDDCYAAQANHDMDVEIEEDEGDEEEDYEYMDDIMMVDIE